MHWTDIENQLQARSEEVCRRLFPAGRREGGEYVVGSLAGEEGHSLKINLTGKLGVWRDFAGDRGGKSLISLWLHAQSLPTFGAAVVEAKKWLGLADDRPEQRIRAATPEPVQKPDDSGWKAIAEVWAQCATLLEGGPVWEYLTKKRGLSPEVLAIYDVREYLTHGQWAIAMPYFLPPEPDAAVVITPKSPVPAWIKFELLARPQGKKKEWTSKAPDKSLFGMQLDAHPAFRRCRHVLICEGEKDALTWASYGCAAWSVLPVSVPFGAKWKGQDKNRPSPNRDWLDRCWDWLDNFETVFVQMDSDEAGQRAAADIINEVGPRRCRLVTLPVKEEIRNA
jgi:twinkle protein